VQALKNGQTVNDIFNISSVDGTSHQITVVVTGANDAATISVNFNGAVTEDTLLSASGNVSVADVDAGESFFNTNISNVGTPLGSLSITAAGNWSYSLDNSLVQYLQAGETKVESFIVQSVDGSASQQIDITITGTNDIAVISGTASGAVTEDDAAVLQASGSLSVADADHDQSSFKTVVSNVGSPLGNLTINAAGNWSYSLDNSLVQYLQAGETKVESFIVQSLDGSASQQIDITITGTNDAPSIIAPSSIDIGENSQLVVDVNASDPDGETENGGGLVYSITGGDDSAKFTINANTGILSFISAPDFENPSDVGSDNIYDVQVSVTDLNGSGLTYSQGIRINVIDLDDNLFTNNPDSVNFNQLDLTQIEQVNNGADLYHALNGNDIVILPDTTSIPGTTKFYDPSQTFFAGAGDDTIIGGNLDDIIDGGDGRDGIAGGAGNDTLSGGNDNDQLYGEDGDDILNGGGGDDYLDGGDGNDTLAGGMGVNFLIGGKGNDTHIDQGGDDLVVFSGMVWQYNFALVNGNVQITDTIANRDDTDTLVGTIERLYFNNIVYDLYKGINSGENIQIPSSNSDLIILGFAGDDSLVSGSGNDYLYGGDGNDGILSGSGNDRLYGEVGNDLLIGDDGDDYLDGGAGNDNLSGGAGTDTARFTGSIQQYDFALSSFYDLQITDRVNGRDGVDNITSIEKLLFNNVSYDLYIGTNADNTNNQSGSSSNLIMLGFNGNDSLTCGSGNDFLEGGAGSDILTGGAGNDIYRFVVNANTQLGTDTLTESSSDAGTDTLDFSGSSQAISINLGIQNYQTVANSNGSSLTIGTFGGNFENVVGGDADDTFTGNSFNNKLTGGGGNDTINIASGGVDTILYNNITDRGTSGNIINGFTAGAGGDVINFYNILQLFPAATFRFIQSGANTLFQVSEVGVFLAL